MLCMKPQMMLLKLLRDADIIHMMTHTITTVTR